LPAHPLSGKWIEALMSLCRLPDREDAFCLFLPETCHSTTGPERSFSNFRCFASLPNGMNAGFGRNSIS
jgi:hypothetical protein